MAAPHNIIAVILDGERIEVRSEADYEAAIQLAKDRHGEEYHLPIGSWQLVKR